MMKMMTQQVYQEEKEVNKCDGSIKDKVEELTRSVSKVYRYELLTTNQYLEQMELVLEIFNEIKDSLQVH
jgi:CRISPR/Cas system CMR subunit Cmr6 (Cas7 group RAMP superfamily)